MQRKVQIDMNHKDDLGRTPDVVMAESLICLSQSDDESTAQAARMALFSAGILHDDSDGGLNECKLLFNQFTESIS